ncbi:hypothetical protein [Delftia sp. DT-2]|uniref:hypothetical protein n=1 Tax=Delftia sp. DT-2 TaxID=3022772 RepID=UPI00233F5A65|nr:hypothetical protein [Delftia sp. DT-2]MDC2862662.1 hypothetical protein [Delftia sp. DT-2]
MSSAIQPFSHSAIQPFSHSAIQPFSHYIPFCKAVLCIAIIIAFISPNNSFAEKIFVTPGSLAGYTYYPPEKKNGGGGGGGGDDSTTLQRCLFTVSEADKTVTVNPEKLYDYEKPIQMQYTIVGGDGGGGFAGGGGGSSAILLNGAAAVVAPGGNGGERAKELRGRIAINAKDRIRFVIGGGGGGGISYSDSFGTNVLVGGGGGAGWQGGGAGASHVSESISYTDNKQAAGKGGGSVPGQGGYVQGGLSGTSGIGSQAGVATYPDGASNSYGTDNNREYKNLGQISGGVNTFRLQEPQISRIPATALRQGSMSRPFFKTYTPNYYVDLPTAVVNGVFRKLPNVEQFVVIYGGGGGQSGRSGFPGSFIIGGCDRCFGYGYGISYTFRGKTNEYFDNTGISGPTIESLQPPTLDLNLTRPFVNDDQPANPGQVAISYQAPVCGLLE